MAQEVLTHLKEHPDAWTRVDTILEFSQNMNTKVSSLDSSKHGWKDTCLCFEEDVFAKLCVPVFVYSMLFIQKSIYRAFIENNYIYSERVLWMYRASA